MRAAIGFALLFVVIISANTELSLQCRVVVPKKYRHTPFDLTLNGQSDSARYTLAYEAFWWNCIAVRAIDLDARCPFQANGTPAAVAGAADGAINADEQIERLLRKHSEQIVKKYLRSIKIPPEAQEKMYHYFKKPTSEVVK